MRDIQEFGKDRSGAVAIIFAMSVLVLGMSVGLAVDYGRAHATRLRLQNALDAAVMAAAKKMMAMSEPSDSDVDQAVKTFFAADQPTNHYSSIVSITGVPIGGDTVRGAAVARIPTTFMQLTGIETLEIATAAEASFGLGNAEIALVLDTTGSMSGGKLESLKASAKDLIDTVEAQPGARGRVKFALVPFGQYVNVGLSNRNAAWMNVPADYSTTTRSCSMVRPVIGSSNCRMQTFSYSVDGVTHSYDSEVCDHDYGAEVEQCNDYTSTYTRNGCTGSRDYPLNIQDANYSVRIPGILNATCPAAVKPLTDDGDAVKAAIDGMNAVGDTYIPAGLAWGWRLLSPVAPFSEGADPVATGSNRVRKFLILMTDGENTRSIRNVGTQVNDHSGSDRAEANRITSELCTNIKADNIEIFSIAFDVPNEAIKDILRGCISPRGAFYDTAGGAQLANAFKDIAVSLGELRISK